uniref:Uncharacterized protein n=1 Tax=Opuntia streptacantha TaxID=393608 RepID=A0A7C9DRS8_OPUST
MQCCLVSPMSISLDMLVLQSLNHMYSQYSFQTIPRARPIFPYNTTKKRAFLIHELLQIIEFAELSVTQSKNLGAVYHCRDSMGYCYTVQSLNSERMIFWMIDRCCGFIKNQYLSSLQ